MSKRGFGILEVVIAAAVLIVVVLGLSTGLQGIFKGSKVASDRSQCQNLITNLVQNVQAQQNSLIVRNYLPATSSSARAGSVPKDPLCTGDEKRSALCDQLNLFYLNGSSIDTNNVYLSQNIRGGATWALNLYNSSKAAPSATPPITKPVCLGEGLVFRKSQNNLGDFEKLMPMPISLPAWVEEAAVKIEQVNNGAPVACGTGDSAANAKRNISFRVNFKIKYLLKLDGATTEQSCAGTANASYTADSTAPTITSVRVQNLNSDDIPLGALPYQKQCTCRKLWNPGPCNEMYGVNITVAASEPGSIFLCKRFDPPPADTGYIYCGDLPGGNMKLIDKNGNQTAATYNEPTRAQFSFTGLADGFSYKMEVVAMDIGGNLSPAQHVQFYVNKPSCPPSNTYCPGGDRPDDGCDNTCPDDGTMPPDCPNPGSFCGGPVEDSCGRKCADGSNCPNPCEPTCPNSNSYCPGTTVKDGCGNDCPNGTKTGCTGPDPDDTPPPACVPPAKDTVVDDQAKCCGQGVYYCKEWTAKWIKDFAYDRFCCSHNPGPLGPAESLDKKNPGLHACWASNKPRSRCWQVNKYVCLGPGSEGRFIVAPNCSKYQALCGYSGAWHDDKDGGSGNPYVGECK